MMTDIPEPTTFTAEEEAALIKEALRETLQELQTALLATRLAVEAAQKVFAADPGSDHVAPYQQARAAHLLVRQAFAAISFEVENTIKMVNQAHQLG